MQIDLLEQLIAEVRALRVDLARRERGALNRQEAAAYLGVSNRTLYLLARQGRIRQTRVSDGCVRYRVIELERYLEANEREVEPVDQDDAEWLREMVTVREVRS